MKKLVLLGDSIRLLGYGERVAELLKDCCETWQPKENCRFAKYTLRMLYDYRKDLQGADVIHWNNGLWDTCELWDDDPFTALEEYCQTMLAIARRLKEIAPRVIFATTTPCHPEHKGQNHAVIRRYNEALVPELKKMGIVINDLYAVVNEDIPRYLCEDKIHLSSEGIVRCADEVAGIVRKNLSLEE